MNRLRLISPLALLALTGCATHRPCHEAGDLDHLPPIKGNRQCTQIRKPDGNYVNQGPYIQWHPNGSIAISGEFKDGEKNGVWMFYDEKNKLIAERYYDKGVERAKPVEDPEADPRSKRRR